MDYKDNGFLLWWLKKSSFSQSVGQVLVSPSDTLDPSLWCYWTGLPRLGNLNTSKEGIFPPHTYESSLVHGESCSDLCTDTLGYFSVYRFKTPTSLHTPVHLTKQTIGSLWWSISPIRTISRSATRIHNQQSSTVSHVTIQSQFRSVAQIMSTGDKKLWIKAALHSRQFRS